MYNSVLWESVFITISHEFMNFLYGWDFWAKTVCARKEQINFKFFSFFLVYSVLVSVSGALET